MDKKRGYTQKGFLIDSDFKRKEVKKMKKAKWFVVMSVISVLCLAAVSAHAFPTLIQDEPTKFKLTNFERWITGGNVNDTNWLDQGDVIEGIFNITTISDITDSNTTWSDTAGGDELTGHFQFTITGGSMNPALGAVISFGLGPNDFIRAYYATTDNWDPKQTDAVARATDGGLYFEVLGSDLIEGIARDVMPGVTQTNWWYNLTTNNTGYTMVPQLWPEVLGGGPFIHPVPGGMHLTGHTSQMYLEGSIYNYGLYGWDFRSEDPGYVFPTPEPATMLLFGSGLVGITGFARRRITKRK